MNKLILCLLFSIPVLGQDTIVFKGAEILTGTNVSAIKLYAYDINKGCDRATPVSLINKGKISPCARYVKTFEKEKVKQIIQLLRSEATYGGEPAACFETSYSLMMSDKANVVIGYVDISLFCNRLTANPLISETARKKGFSKTGKEALLLTLELVSEDAIVAPSEN